VLGAAVVSPSATAVRSLACSAGASAIADRSTVLVKESTLLLAKRFIVDLSACLMGRGPAGDHEKGWAGAASPAYM
jgi:hypothetical protein